MKHELYESLLDLCNNKNMNDTFAFVDQPLDDKVYRIFTYRLASWTTFQEHPMALECRGSMFDVTDEDNVKIVCRPPKKFFNYAEGGVNHTINKILTCHEKLDGSLISSYIHNGSLRLKSKGSIKSEQAMDAMKWLMLPENKLLNETVWKLTSNNKTVNFEWIGPQNRIVVGYKDTKLAILSVRDNVTGEIELPDAFTTFDAASEIHMNLSVDLDDIVNEMYKETTGEGYVITLLDSNNSIYQVKVKNFKYCNLHKIKDSITYPESLAELIIRGQSDDVIEAFTDDEITLNIIYEMEDTVIPLFNNMIRVVEQFHQMHKNDSRKDYAICAKNEYPLYMPLLMDMYIERPIDYEQFAVKNMTKLFGIKNPAPYSNK